MSAFKMATDVDKSSVDVMDVVIRNLGYEANAVRSNLRTAKFHPTYLSQADVRKSGHALNGALSLAVRLSAQFGVNIPAGIREEIAAIAKQAIAFKK